MSAPRDENLWKNLFYCSNRTWANNFIRIYCPNMFRRRIGPRDALAMKRRGASERNSRAGNFLLPPRAHRGERKMHRFLTTLEMGINERSSQSEQPERKCGMKMRRIKGNGDEEIMKTQIRRSAEREASISRQYLSKIRRTL